MTIVYVTIINISFSYNMRNPETRTRYLRRLLIKIKNQYPSEDNVTIITLFFGLASGQMEGGGATRQTQAKSNAAIYDKV